MACRLAVQYCRVRAYFDKTPAAPLPPPSCLGQILTSSRPVPPTTFYPFLLPFFLLTTLLFSIDSRSPQLRQRNFSSFPLVLARSSFSDLALDGGTLDFFDNSSILSVLPFNSNIPRSLGSRFTRTTNTTRLGSTFLKPTTSLRFHSPDILFTAGHFSEYCDDIHSLEFEAGLSLDLQS